ncbi:MAG: hypothetical protein Q8P64_05665, partial [Deltaproteobacteria bacterium]|nr:hypothetical protein [Deltaproteobacteria bacterium]
MNKKKGRTKHPRKKRAKKGFAFYIILAFLSSAFLLFLSGALLFLYFSRQLPDYASLKERNLNAYSIVY